MEDKTILVEYGTKKFPPDPGKNDLYIFIRPLPRNPVMNETVCSIVTAVSESSIRLVIDREECIERKLDAELDGIFMRRIKTNSHGDNSPDILVGIAFIEKYGIDSAQNLIRQYLPDQKCEMPEGDGTEFLHEDLPPDFWGR